nr:hypothetical protein [uncultured Prevotella sp.]
MKKFFYLMALVCTLGFFTACSDDNDDPQIVRNEKIEGTWNLEENSTVDMGDQGELIVGSAKFTWDCPADTKITIDMGGFPMELPVTTVTALVNNLANTYLPQVLKDVTFTADGKINATYADLPEDTESVSSTTPAWKKAEGYATYKVVNDNLINVTVDADKATDNIEDLQEKAQIKAILQKYNSIPVNIRWNGTKPYFYVDKAFVQPLLANLVAMISQVPTDSIDEDDLATFNMIKAIVNQLPDIMENTTTFEAGLELTK